MRSENTRAQRQVRRGQAFGGGDDVWDYAKQFLAGEEGAQAPERGHHFVGDEQDVVGLAQLPHALEVALGRNDHPARAHDRLGEERRHVVGTQRQDLVLELGHQVVEEFGLSMSCGARYGLGLETWWIRSW